MSEAKVHTAVEAASLPHGRVVVEYVKDVSAREALRQMNENIAAIAKRASAIASAYAGGSSSSGVVLEAGSGIVLRRASVQGGIGGLVSDTSGGGRFVIEAVYV